MALHLVKYPRMHLKELYDHNPGYESVSSVLYPFVPPDNEPCSFGYDAYSAGMVAAWWLYRLIPPREVLPKGNELLAKLVDKEEFLGMKPHLYVHDDEAMTKLGVDRQLLLTIRGLTNINQKDRWSISKALIEIEANKSL